MLLFSPFPQTLEIDEADSHISTATTTTRMNLILKNRPVKRYAIWGQGQRDATANVEPILYTSCLSELVKIAPMLHTAVDLAKSVLMTNEKITSLRITVPCRRRIAGFRNGL
jgi:hypothetical protein